MTYGTSKWRDWVLDEEEATPFIHRAFDAGINFFDTADMYSKGASETVLGKAIKGMAPRHELVIATKVYNPMTEAPNDRGLSRKHIMEGIDNSLRRLGLDYVDLYQIHRFDYDTPLEETLEALHDVVKAGKALYLGASSMHAWQFMKALSLQERHGWARFVAMQDHYNLLYREEEREMLPLCRAEGVGIIPWSPLARGHLARPVDTRTVRHDTDEFARNLYEPEMAQAIVGAVGRIAEARGVKMAQVALAWLLGRPGVTAPIIGASKPHHLDDALGALDIDLEDKEIEQLEQAYRPQPVRGHV